MAYRILVKGCYARSSLAEKKQRLIDLGVFQYCEALDRLNKPELDEIHCKFII